MFPRDFQRPKRAKIKDILESGCKVGAGCGSACLPFGVPAGVSVQALVACPLLSWRVPCLLSALSLCWWCVSLEICLYSHFKAVFSAFLLFRVGLFVLGALRGLCGFCTRVELGG